MIRRLSVRNRTAGGRAHLHDKPKEFTDADGLRQLPLVRRRTRAASWRVMVVISFIARR